jgi:hypothetical protein
MPNFKVVETILSFSSEFVKSLHMVFIVGLKHIINNHFLPIELIFEVSF